MTRQLINYPKSLVFSLGILTGVLTVGNAQASDFYNNPSKLSCNTNNSSSHHSKNIVLEDDYNSSLEKIGIKIIRGTAKQGSVMIMQGDDLFSVTIDNKVIKVSSDGFFVFGIRSDRESTINIRIQSNNCAINSIKLYPKKQKYLEQHIKGIQSKYVTPSAQALKRIRNDTRNVLASRDANSDTLHFVNQFEWPLSGIITGVYGTERSYNGVKGSPHWGIDIAAPKGDVVYSPAGGRVTLAEDLYYSGNTLIIDHGHGVFSTLLHLDKLNVGVGDIVIQCQQIGLVGSTGRSTGAHLDWRLNWFRVRLNPITLFGDNNMSNTASNCT